MIGFSLNNFPLFQGTFERVSYEIIGDDEAPVYFQINSQTGVISVRTSLATASDSVFVSLKNIDRCYFTISGFS